MNHKNINIILAYLLPRVNTYEFELPKLLINKYKLISKISPGSPKPFLVGLYEDKSGNKFVAKIWEGKIKDANYYNLLRESKVLRVLNAVQKRVKHGKVRVPELANYLNQDNQLIVITKFAGGKRVNEIKSIKTQLEIYQKSREFLLQLSNSCTKAEMNTIGIKNGKDFLIQYPFILTKSLITYPNKWKELLKGGLNVTIGLRAFFTSHKCVFVHGDLHLSNILVSESQITILDFEQSTFSFPELETVTSLASRLNPREIKEKLSESFTKSLEKNPRAGMLAIICSTHDLIERVSIECLNSYTQILVLANKQLTK